MQSLRHRQAFFNTVKIGLAGADADVEALGSTCRIRSLMLCVLILTFKFPGPLLKKKISFRLGYLPHHKLTEP